MSVIDIILFRVDAICKKYDKYEHDVVPNHHPQLIASAADPFSQLYVAVESKIEAAIRKSEAASMETSCATVVATNAEIRRAKDRMMDDVLNLQILALKNKVKGLSKEELSSRNDMVLALQERIKSIPNGTTYAVKQTGGWAASVSHKNIKFDSVDFFQQTEESSQFREECEMLKMKQD